jgi:putative ABC transport system permease protein
LENITKLTKNFCITQYSGEARPRWHFRDPVTFLDETLEEQQSTSPDFPSLYESLDDPLLSASFEIRKTLLRLQPMPAAGIEAHVNLDHWPGKYPGETVEMGVITTTGDYFKTLGIKIKEGRYFVSAQSDISNTILNEAAVTRLRLKDPINQIITKDGKQLRIIGVVKDALMNSPFDAADPTMFEYGDGDYMMYRLAPNANTHQDIEKLSQIFNKYSPSYPYQYTFVDQDYAHKFSEEVLVGKLAGIFAGLAIFISCLGLFGLAAFVAEQRTKEIGVRKVLGATVTEVWMLLSKDFIVLVVISCLIASPAALYFFKIGSVNTITALS